PAMRVVDRYRPAGGANALEERFREAVLPKPGDLAEIGHSDLVEAHPDIVAEPTAGNVIHAIVALAPFDDRHLAPGRGELDLAHAAMQEDGVIGVHQVLV